MSYPLEVHGFEWDDGNTFKCQRHGISIAEVEAVFQGNPRVAPDIRHSQDESRFIAIGRTGGGRPLFVAFTIRRRFDRTLIRPITARYMHAKEIARYESQDTAHDDG